MQIFGQSQRMDDDASTQLVATAQCGAAPPPFTRAGPAAPCSPVVISVPHAGRYYAPDLLEQARVDAVVLQRFEDRHVDALTAGLAAAGHVVITAQHARACIDLNRDEREWDAALVADARPRHPVTPRVHSGLGLVPRRLHGVGDIWRERISHAELQRRITTYHRPYHRAIADALVAARERFGRAILLDLHSMPTQAGGEPHMVVGDRHGATASLQLVDALLAVGEGQGLTVARNVPYAGAHSVERHADVRRGIEAAQIEFDRSLYLTADGHPDAAGVARIGRIFAAMVALADSHVRAAATAWRDAAE